MPKPKLVIPSEYRDDVKVALKFAFEKFGMRWRSFHTGEDGCRIFFNEYRRDPHEFILKLTFERHRAGGSIPTTEHAGYSFIDPCLSERRLQKRAEAIARRMARKFPELIAEGL